MEKIEDEVKQAVTAAESEDCALVIDGKALSHALDIGLDDDIVKLGELCKSVVCCRSTPIQKQLVVQLMKEKLNVRCLAVGDGANDVAMIQEAHVGVGVMGNEGMQAVMSGDFVIGQFRFLKRLLLVHGRWNYHRLGFLVIYTIYKNIFLTFIPFWFCFFSMWSGSVCTPFFSLTLLIFFILYSMILFCTSLIACSVSRQIYLDPWITALWNFIFTAAPSIAWSLLDQDLPADILLQYPGSFVSKENRKKFESIWSSQRCIVMDRKISLSMVPNFVCGLRSICGTLLFVFLDRFSPAMASDWYIHSLIC